MSIFQITSPAGKTYHFDWYFSPGHDGILEQDYYMGNVFEGQMPPYEERYKHKPHAYIRVYDAKEKIERYPQVVGNILDTLPQTQAEFVRIDRVSPAFGWSFPFFREDMLEIARPAEYEHGFRYPELDYQNYSNVTGFEFIDKEAIILHETDTNGKTIYWLVHPDLLDVGIDNLKKLAKFLTTELQHEGFQPVRCLKTELSKPLQTHTIRGRFGRMLLAESKSFLAQTA